MAKVHPAIIAVGKNKGHKTTALKVNPKNVKQSRTKGRLGKRVKLIRQVINEVSGVATYEKRVIELLKAGSLKDTKKALKVSKAALGTHQRAKLKREGLMNMLRAQQKQGQKK